MLCYDEDVVVLPRKYILPIKPAEYLKQGPMHCGAYSVKGILSAFGLDTRRRPKEYHPTWVGKVTGLSIGKNYWANILRSHGIQAERKTAAHLPDAEKLYLLKALLAGGNPVMVRIGNGYFLGRWYNPLFGWMVAHWMTLWGYDDDKEIFYVYDSAFSRRYWNASLPVGNTTRTYAEILRDWRFGWWQCWYWYMGRGSHVYVGVRGSE